MIENNDHKMNFKNVYQNKKVLVTGNTGFKGTWLSTWLLELGAEVYGISHDIPSNPSIFEELKLSEKMIHFNTDIRDLKKMKEIINHIKPDFCFHLAAQAIVSESYIDPIGTLTTNVIGTANILEALRLVNHPCTTIIITSDKVYDNVEWKWGYRESDHIGGKDPYSASKGGAEMVVKTYFRSFFSKPESNIKIAVGRAGNVIGGGDWADNRIVPDCMRAWSKNLPVTVRNPKAIRPWQHVLESVSGYLTLGEKLHFNEKLNGEPFNFGPAIHQTVSVFELLEGLSKHWEFDSFVQKYDINSQQDFKESFILKLCSDKAAHDLKWKATLEYKEMVAFTSSWYKTFYSGEEMFDFTIKQIHEYGKLAIERAIPQDL
jgi:CDP-glucose 4,6-dehydratase